MISCLYYLLFSILWSNGDKVSLEHRQETEDGQMFTGTPLRLSGFVSCISRPEKSERMILRARCDRG